MREVRPPGHLGPARRHHGPVDVVDHHPAGGPDGLGGQEGQVGGAAADVQDPIPGLQPQEPHRGPFPRVVHPEAQQGVHEVVAGGHRVEVLVHQLFFGRGPTGW